MLQQMYCLLLVNALINVNMGPYCKVLTIFPLKFMEKLKVVVQWEYRDVGKI